MSTADIEKSPNFIRKKFDVKSNYKMADNEIKPATREIRRKQFLSNEISPFRRLRADRTNLFFSIGNRPKKKLSHLGFSSDGP